MAINNFTNSGGGNSGGSNNINNIANALNVQIPQHPTTPDTQAIMDGFAIDYNQKFASADKIKFRDAIISQTMAVLIGKDKANALLVGPAGVGKTKIVEDLARMIATGDPRLPDNLKDTTIYEVSLSNLVAGCSHVGELEEKVKLFLDIATDPKNKIIVFIDEIHQLMTGSKQYQEIAQFLKPAMSRGTLKLIGATTSQESQSLIDDPAFNRRFTKIIVDELTREQTIEVLKDIRGSFNNHYGSLIKIDDASLETVAVIADQYASAGNHRPDTAITLLDRACSELIVGKKEAEARALESNDIPLYDIIKKQILNLTESKIKKTALRIATGQSAQTIPSEDELREKLSQIKGQDDIINDIIKRLVKKSKGLFPQKTPTAFMFAGKSGVGKTETTKIIADLLTGVKPIILNMTEYHNSAHINRIIGSPAGYVGSDSNAELPFDCLESNPYQVILLDEFEKADKAVQRLFMGALDEGFIKTARGKVVDFSKSIIIATTNASHTTKADAPIGFNQMSKENNKKAEENNLKKWFDVELLNRFTKIFSFNPLSKETYSEILKDMYEKEMARIKHEHRRINAPDSLDEDILNKLVEESYNADYGARPARKTIVDYIEEII